MHHVSMAHDVTMALVTLAVSGIGGFFAAWSGGLLGVRRETEKLTQARAFNQQQDWYKDALSALAQLQYRHMHYLLLLTTNPQEARNERERLTGDIVAKFSMIYQQSLAYAHATTVRHLCQLSEKTQTIKQQNLSGSLSDAQAADKIQRALAEAFAHIALDARSHLNLDALPPDLVSY